MKCGEFENSPSGFDDFFDGIKYLEVAIEMSDAWQSVYDYLDENGYDVKLAHPYKTRIIAEVKIKTDTRDSEALANLVRAGLIPEGYVPREKDRELRRVVKRRGNSSWIEQNTRTEFGRNSANVESKPMEKTLE